MPKETEVLALFFQSPSSPEKSPQLKYLENLATGKLVHMRDGNITLYKRERSKQWQMRFRLYDKKWHRVSTGYEDLEYAKKKAGDIYDRARFMEELGLPPLNKRFDSAAEATKVELQSDLDNGVGKKIYVDYISVIDNYLIPFFGKKFLTNINHQDIAEYELWRAEKMKRKLMHSTMMTHFSAYNRVFDSAIKRGWLSDKHPVPRLGSKGEKSTPRPAFTRKEIDHLFVFIKTWSEGGKNEEAHNGRLLLRDYIEILMATGNLTKQAQQSLKSALNTTRGVFILTTNNISQLDKGLLDRCVLVEMNAAQASEYLAIANAIVAKTGTQLSEAELLPTIKAANGSFRNLVHNIGRLARRKSQPPTNTI